MKIVFIIPGPVCLGKVSEQYGCTPSLKNREDQDDMPHQGLHGLLKFFEP